MPKRRYPPSQDLLDSMEAERQAKITIRKKCTKHVRSPTFTYRIKAPDNDRNADHNEAEHERINYDCDSIIELGRRLVAEKDRKALGEGAEVEMWKGQMERLLEKAEGWVEELRRLEVKYIKMRHKVHGR
ncbi:MAG: hypothetical protein Q9184_002856 [Pyrenodesmia sp. 2 TL-2023]